MANLIKNLTDTSFSSYFIIGYDEFGCFFMKKTLFKPIAGIYFLFMGRQHDIDLH